MRVRVEVNVPESVVQRVTELVTEMYGKVPTTEELVEFFKQDIGLCYEQFAITDDFQLEEAVESFFYVEA